MHTWRRKAWWASGIGAAVLLLGAVILHAAVDKARLMELAKNRVKTAYGRELTMGDLELQFLPLPTLTAKKVALSNAAWARDRSFLEADAVKARLQLLPLFGGQVAVDSISIDGLRANLETASDGRVNWSLGPAARPSGGAGRHRFSGLQVFGARIVYRRPGADPVSLRIDELNARAHSGWRKVRLEANLTRNKQPMTVKAELADLSRIGDKGALTDATIQLLWPDAHLTLNGKLPLDTGFEGLELKAAFDSRSMDGLFGFLAVRNGKVVPLSASAALRGIKGGLEIAGLQVKLNDFSAGGSARVTFAGARPLVDARLHAERLDWAKVLTDAGRPPPPPKPPGEMFHNHALAWPLLAALEKIDGAIDMRIRTIKLRSGVELREARARVALKGEKQHVTHFSANLLGGSASGDAVLEARRKTARINLDANNISLGEWLAQREHRDAVRGGPMKIAASITATGASVKELAASVTGTVDVRIGPARVQSSNLQQAESLLIGLAPMLSAKESQHVELACAGARLQFVAGRAEAQGIAGARSDVSQILTSGHIDLRRQTLDLRGKIRARSGVNLGISTLAGEVRIAGPILQPDVGIDPSSAPGILARIGAAIATGGASLLVTSIWDAANPASDPCQIVFKPREKPAQ